MKNGQVRLVGGRLPSEGRVEFALNGAWGGVCDNNWSMNDADVVCRMLGYSRAIRASRGASFGEGSGDTLLNNVACRGSEHSLSDCPHSVIRRADCGHGKDAGVVCWDDNFQGKAASFRYVIVDKIV